MKHLKIVEVLSMRKVQIGVIIILLMYLLIHLLIMKAYPFADLFSFTELSVQSVNKTDFNPFIEEDMIKEPDINGKVREVEKFDLETSAKDVELLESLAKPSIDPNEAFECGAEIPILVMKSDERTFIRRSIGRDDEIHWQLYRKVTDIKVKSEYGFDTTLANILERISKTHHFNETLRYRPDAYLIQGGQNSISEQTTVENETNNSQKINDNRQTGNQCDNNQCGDENISNRLNFPIYAPNIY